MNKIQMENLNLINENIQLKIKLAKARDIIIECNEQLKKRTKEVAK